MIVRMAKYEELAVGIGSRREQVGEIVGVGEAPIIRIPHEVHHSTILGSEILNDQSCICL